MLKRTVLFALVLGLALDAAAQTPLRRQPAQPETGPVEIALDVGGKKYDFSGQAECKAAPQASIYGVPAALHSVSQSGPGQSLSLTLWQPRDGAPAMMTLFVASGSRRLEVDTMKAGAKRDTKGSGSAILQKSGEGGVFTVTAQAASGEKIQGTIRCGRFGGLRAEGG